MTSYKRGVRIQHKKHCYFENGIKFIAQVLNDIHVGNQGQYQIFDFSREWCFSVRQPCPMERIGSPWIRMFEGKRQTVVNCSNFHFRQFYYWPVILLNKYISIKQLKVEHTQNVTSSLVALTSGFSYLISQLSLPRSVLRIIKSRITSFSNWNWKFFLMLSGSGSDSHRRSQ